MLVAYQLTACYRYFNLRVCSNENAVYKTNNKEKTCAAGEGAAKARYKRHNRNETSPTLDRGTVVHFTTQYQRWHRCLPANR
jgi:hypothetical protein